MEECGFCKERDEKIRGYEEEIQKEKERECQRALEREAIAKGMRCTKQDEIELREMQKLQMEERRKIEEREGRVDWMWHQVLLDDVQRKEQHERMEFERRRQEMIDRRKAYDEQISSANRKRQEALREEREKENRRLENMRQKMELDHYEEQKRKKDQQLTNRKNYIEGHEMKLSRQYCEQRKDWQIDRQAVSVATEEMRRERQRKLDQMHKLQLEKQIFIQNFNREREIASMLDKDAEQMTSEWKHQEEIKADEKRRQMEEERRREREKAAEEYNNYIKERNNERERQKKERENKMAHVKRSAYNELKKKLDSSNEELIKQMEYRDSLGSQIRMNQQVLDNELQDIETKQRPFSKKPLMFKEAMDCNVAKSPGRKSTNPIHPFRQLMEKQQPKNLPVHLPHINTCN